MTMIPFIFFMLKLWAGILALCFILEFLKRRKERKYGSKTKKRNQSS